MGDGEVPIPDEPEPRAWDNDHCRFFWTGVGRRCGVGEGGISGYVLGQANWSRRPCSHQTCTQREMRTDGREPTRGLTLELVAEDVVPAAVDNFVDLSRIPLLNLLSL